MIKVSNVAQIRAIEAAADAKGFSYQTMMENAGRAAADRAKAILADIPQPKITILVGAGNNGGDGLVTGLLIAQDNPEAEVRFYLLKDRDDNYSQVARQAELFIALAENDGDKRVLRNMIASSDLVIDALFGIGVRLPIQDEAQKVLRQVNTAINERRRAKPETSIINPAGTGQIPHAAPIYVLALDCPSGLDCDTGAIDRNAIHADETISFITAKQGHFLYPAADYVGQLTVASIGIPEVPELKDLTTIVLDSETVREKLPARPTDSHKGTYGRALIVAGSLNYIGAPALAAEAAYRSGAGLVTVGTVGNVIQALAGQLREVTWLMLPHDMGVIAEAAVPLLAKELSAMKSLLIGCGLTSEKSAKAFLEAFLQQASKTNSKPSKRRLGFQALDDETKAKADETLTLPPLVIDADGLNLLAEMDSWWTLLPENTILTPHPAEMGRLAKLETAEAQARRWELARKKAQEWKVILVLKGAHTVIASPTGDLAILPFKTDALATAGTGDILAGLIVGLLAQGLNAYDAALVGAYVQGLAGLIAAEYTSSRSVIATDVLAAIGQAFAAIED